MDQRLQLQDYCILSSYTHTPQKESGTIFASIILQMRKMNISESKVHDSEGLVEDYRMCPITQM